MNGLEILSVFSERPSTYIIPPYFLTVRRREDGIFEQGWISGYGGPDVL
jgi:hypothetical protein